MLQRLKARNVLSLQNHWKQSWMEKRPAQFPKHCAAVSRRRLTQLWYGWLWVDKIHSHANIVDCCAHTLSADIPPGYVYMGFRNDSGEREGFGVMRG
eukprot:3780410-Amphidinium_carterae.1